MGRSLFIAACLAGVLSAPMVAQQSTPPPDAPQPQPQKKPATKPPVAPPASDASQPQPSQPQSSSDPKDSKPASKDDNAFPEDVSKAAAAKAAADANAPNPQESTPATGQHSTSTDNPFPEAESKAAAKAAGNDTETTPTRDIPHGVSSSRSSSLEDMGSLPGKLEPDPARAKKDTEVGSFYFKSGNFQGALDRFQEATTYDSTNVDAIFGLAEAQRMLKKNADAARNYQMYLDILPNGPKSKQALKALKALTAGG